MVDVTIKTFSTSYISINIFYSEYVNLNRQ